jgi:hypothetical protein
MKKVSYLCKNKGLLSLAQNETTAASKRNSNMYDKTPIYAHVIVLKGMFSAIV